MVGDAGMFVNSVHREGSNLAMTTGRHRRRDADRAAQRRQGLHGRQSRTLSQQTRRQFRHEGSEESIAACRRFLEKNPQFFTQYPELINRAAHTMLLVDGADKKSKERDIRQEFHPQAVAARSDR
jgi:electron transfer flavoprotein-quinone oxidoreductase